MSHISASQEYLLDELTKLVRVLTKKRRELEEAQRQIAQLKAVNEDLLRRLGLP